MNKEEIFLSVVIPAYNESRRIGKTLNIILDYLEKKDFNYEIIVVDDGSKDNTKQLAEALKIPNLRIESYGENRGKGYAINHGVNQAKGKYILFADADNSTPFQEVDRLLEHIEQYDVVIGSRYLKNSNIKVKQSFLRIMASRFGNLLIQILILPGIPDTQCGFKMFKQTVAKKIFYRQTIWRWGFDMEILRIAKEQKMTIKQVSVDWYNDEASRIQSRKVFLKTLNELFRIRWNSFVGLYRH